MSKKDEQPKTVIMVSTHGTKVTVDEDLAAKLGGGFKPIKKAKAESNS